MEEHLRICFVCHSFAPSIGGAQARAEKQARQLHALGHDVTIITLRTNRDWKRTERHNGLQIVRVGGIYRHGGWLREGRLGHWLFDIGMFLTLLRLRNTYDLIHVFQLSSIAAAAVLVGKMTCKPTIISIGCEEPSEAQLTQLEQGAKLMADTLTNADFLEVKNKDVALGDITYVGRIKPGGRAILNFVRKSNAFYQILSTRCRSYLVRNGFRAEQIVHISGSVDTEKFQPVPERRPDPTRPERNIICVARLDYSKGVDVLLHAWGRMVRTSAEWRAHLKPRLLIVGDGKFRPQMERIVAELDISDTVEFLGSRTDIPALLQAAWGFVLPSRWEGMPNALLEAMACGLPCVVTRVSGSEDIISDGVNGLLVEPEQPVEMALALRRILEDVDLARQLGQAGRATVVREYQVQAIVEQCLEFYRYLLEGEKKRNHDMETLQRALLQVGIQGEEK
jgi:glycosyltransferase involved in cell wall biosynthesis